MVLHQRLSFVSPNGEGKSITLAALLEEHSDYRLYEAILEDDAKRVAVKLSPRPICPRLRAEGLALLFANQHRVPHAPLYYGESLQEDHLLVTELVEGPTLEEETRRLYPSGVPLLLALEWTYELLSFSAALSKAGFLHLALHPGNIILPDGGPDPRNLKVTYWRQSLPSNTVQDIKTVLGGRRPFQGELANAEKPIHATGYQLPTRSLSDSIDLYSIGMTLVALLLGERFFEHEIDSSHWNTLLRNERSDLFEMLTGEISSGEAIERFLGRLIIDKRDFHRNVRYLSPFENSTSALLAFDRMCEKLLSELRHAPEMNQWGDPEKLRGRLLGYLGRERVAKSERPDKIVYRLPNTKGWDFD